MQSNSENVPIKSVLKLHEAIPHLVPSETEFHQNNIVTVQCKSMVFFAQIISLSA